MSLTPKINSIKKTHIVPTNPTTEQTFKAKIKEKFEPLTIDENKPIKKQVSPIIKPRIIKLIIGCSTALKLAMNTLIIISTNIFNIISPWNQKLKKLDNLFNQ
ncbi:hypothetical protein HUN37_22210 [Acinetobacter bereziniae]|uniref:hypothetical protein n=2 Tax=Acinetobacter bereziniae TaxID=106648 RepID=UPI00158069F7|nr:hypothetical protein [Acinetobacter bereziniae]NUG66125.1 hypothetical protein [Acinetobacter bereziniae]